MTGVADCNRIFEHLKIIKLSKSSAAKNQVRLGVQSITSRCGSRFDIELVGLNGDLHATEHPGLALLELEPKRKLIC